MIDFALPADAVAPQLLGCTLTHAGVSTMGSFSRTLI